MAELRNRGEFERKLARSLGRINQQASERVIEALGDPPNMANLSTAFWDEIGKELQGVLQPTLEQVFKESAQQMLTSQPIGVEWSLVNERAARWAREYSFELVRGMNERSRAALQEQVAGFFEDKRTLGDLRDSISSLFGPVRSEMIAVTETTRAAVQGEIGFAQELQKLGLRTVQVWQTNNDDITCPLCGPLNQKRQGDGWAEPPPAHPRCRCWTSTEVIS